MDKAAKAAAEDARAKVCVCVCFWCRPFVAITGRPERAKAAKAAEDGRTRAQRWGLLRCLSCWWLLPGLIEQAAKAAAEDARAKVGCWEC